MRASRKGKGLLSAGAMLLALLALAPAGASAAPSVVWETEPGLIGTARGIAADPDSGEVFVSDQAGNRLVVLDVWGQLVRTWGWDVVKAGPGNTAEGKLEICVPADGDECQAGIAGSSGAGQFDNAMGIALDPAGNVYAAEAGAPRRVQKFTPQGEFLLSFGGGVNQGGGTPENPGNVCTAQHLANGDVCGAGSTGAGPGEFSGATAQLRTVIAVTPADKVWVGDKERIQRFNSSGVYEGECAVPGEGVQQVAADAGFLYVSYERGSSGISNFNNAKPDVDKLSQATCAASSVEFKASNPRAIALAPNGDVYVFDKDFDKSGPRIRHFNAAGEEEESFGEQFGNGSTGLAIGVACDIDGPDDDQVEVYHSNNSPSFVRAYGPVPDPDLCPRPDLEPVITEQYARSVGITEATVGADINPRFWEDTAYYVQYGTAECLAPEDWEAPCVQSALFPGATVTSEVINEPRPASATLSGLAPDTEYVFRFVAESSGGGPVFGPQEAFTTFPPNPPADTGCANQLFRIGASALLPDCRAFEMVSPVEKNNGDIRVGLNLSDEEQLYPQSTADGDKLTYSSGTSFADAEGAPFASQYIAGRDEDSWSTEAISPPREKNIPSGNNAAFLSNQFVAFSEDLCTAWLYWDGDPPLGEGPTPGLLGYKSLYQRDNCDPSPPVYTALTKSVPPNAVGMLGQDNSFNPVLQGLSADGGHAVYRANDALAVDNGPTPNPGTPGEDSNDQLYEVYDGGKVRLVSVLPGAPGAPSTSQNTIGSNEGYAVGNASNAVSDNGETIFWTASGVFGTTLYARLGGQETVQVASGSGLAFQAAAGDGSAVLYSERIGLLDTLQRYEMGSGETTTIVESGFRGLVGASADLSRIYFVSTNTTLDKGGEVGETGENLYLYDEVAGIELIGTLATGEGAFPTVYSLTSATLAARASRVSPDGRHLAFVSRAPLTEYDNRDTNTGEPDTEVFRYAADTNELHCVSCNPTGARPLGEPEGVLGRAGMDIWKNASGLIPGHKGHFHASRVLSEDGRRLFFESFDRLLPRDTNGNMDVYEWQAPGKGECTTSHPHYFEKNGGCLALISTGKGDGDTDFIEATPSGNDVFIRTEQSLVDEDPGLVDIYDARIGGGFPPPPPGSASCEGDACQPPARTPEFPGPASSGFRGPEGLPGSNPCLARAKQAKRLSGKAKRAKRAARRAGAQSQKKRLRRQGAGLAKRARRSSKQAKRCRVRLRGAGPSGRAGR